MRVSSHFSARRDEILVLSRLVSRISRHSVSRIVSMRIFDVSFLSRTWWFWGPKVSNFSFPLFQIFPFLVSSRLVSAKTCLDPPLTDWPRSDPVVTNEKNVVYSWSRSNQQCSSCYEIEPPAPVLNWLIEIYQKRAFFITICNLNYVHRVGITILLDTHKGLLRNFL